MISSNSEFIAKTKLLIDVSGLTFFTYCLESLSFIHELALDNPTTARLAMRNFSTVFEELYEGLNENEVKIILNFKDAVNGTISYSKGTLKHHSYDKETGTFHTKGCVYFIFNKKENAIKIGYSVQPIFRVNQIQTCSSADLILMAVQSGEQKLEKRIHKKFEAFRLRGEWFYPDESLLKYIENQKKNTASNQH